MIPALMGKKKAVSVVLSGLKDGAEKEVSEGDDLLMVAEDLIRAVESKDATAVSDALRAAWNCLEAGEAVRYGENS